MAAACTGAFGLDRDRSVGQFYSTFWNEKAGAPSEINALAQTSDGYLWIGSVRGLFRFDGVNFEEYKPPSGVSLPSHSIFSMMATPDGGLWIAFEPSGIAFYKDGGLTVFTKRSELPQSPAHCFARDEDGRIWVGTETGLAFRDGDRWTAVGREWNITPEMIRYLYVDREGTLWVATLTRIVYLKRGSKQFENGGAVGTGVTTLSEAPNGKVWLADNGSNEVRPVPMEGGKAAPRGPTIALEGVGDLLFDKDGALWITRLDSGVIRIRHPEQLEARKYTIKDRALESFGPKDGFPAGSAHKILEDREGNIWIGSSDGLVRMRHNQVIPIALPQRYERLTLFAGQHGELWVGTTYDRPLLRISGENIDVEKGGGNAVSSVLRDGDGDVWWGSHDGIWRQKDAMFQYFHLPKGAVPDWMWDLMQSADNNGIWVKLGDVGLVRFKQGIWNMHDWPQGVPFMGGTFRYGPSASYRDASGRFWLGYTSGQVYLVDNGHPTEYSEKDGLDLGRIKVIRDGDGHIWAGGELGLAVFSNGRFWKMQPADADAFGAVSGIITTPDAGLWLNEMNGIVQIPQEEIRQVLADPSHRVACRRFDYLDGLPGSPQMSWANSTAVRTTDGRLWFATEKGLASVDPGHLTRNPLPPPVSIVSVASENGRSEKPGPVAFVAGTHAVEIDYTALSLSMPERVHFRYRLDGINTGWQNVGTRREAYYNNLGPGSYRFQVIASNEDGVWNDQGASVTFTIRPMFYQTAWFRLLVIAAAVLAIRLLYVLRLRHATAEIRARLGERLQERERIARELHDTLLQDFQAVVLRFQIAARRMAEGDPNRAVVEEGLDYADKVLAEGRDYIRDIRADTKASDKLSKSLAAYGNDLAQLRPATFSMKVTGSEPELDPIVRDEIHRIGREAIGNAFHHSNGSKVETEMVNQHGEFRLKIHDDGIGMDPDLWSSGRPGHWGIQSMKERAEKIGASLTISSQPGAGTSLELKLPARSRHRFGNSSRHS
jgi:signal transduction histidine kinase/ligand-binding sensor domain-containing protein